VCVCLVFLFIFKIKLILYFTGLRLQASKYRHAESKFDSVGYTNVRKLNKRLPLETNGFCCSTLYAAVPIEQPGGLVQILEVCFVIKKYFLNYLIL
jgi:hypothetical protein